MFLQICIYICVFVIVSHSLREVSQRSRSRKGKGHPGSDRPQAPCHTAANHRCNHYVPYNKLLYYVTSDLVQLLSHAVLKAEVGGHI